MRNICSFFLLLFWLMSFCLSWTGHINYDNTCYNTIRFVWTIWKKQNIYPSKSIYFQLFNPDFPPLSLFSSRFSVTHAGCEHLLLHRFSFHANEFAIWSTTRTIYEIDPYCLTNSFSLHWCVMFLPQSFSLYME